jgi:hypothetical protein
MRDGWGPVATSLVIDCGPHGALTGAHGHADALSFDLSVRGRAVLVDPGTYTYTGSAELRDRFRSTAGHNTLTVNGESSALPAGPFSWKHTAEGRRTHWTSRNRFDFFAGDHDGYRNSSLTAIHSRSLLFLHGDYVILRDQVEAAGPHRDELHFHAAAGLAGHARDGGVSFSTATGRTEPLLDLLTFGGGAAGEWRIEDGSVSRCHQSRETAPVAIYSADGAGPTEFVTFMFPRSVESGPLSVDAIKVHSGQAFSLSGDTYSDLLLVSDGGLFLHDGIWSDFHWTWARFSDTGALCEAILLDGKDFRVGDEVLLDGTEPLEYARISRVAGQWVIETNAGLITKLATGPVLADASVRRPRLETSFYVRD